MKNNKSWSYGASLGLIGMSLTKMPYPVVATAGIAGMIIFLYYIINLHRTFPGTIKQYWSYIAIFGSAFMGICFFLLNRTIEEFNILMFMKNTSGFLGVFFIVIMFVMLFISAKPEIKKAGGFANYMEDRQPGSWMMMKIGLWILIICAIFVAITFI